MATVADRAREAIARELGIDARHLVDEAMYLDDLNLDLIDVLDVMRSVEEEFDIEISDGVATALTDVGATIDHVCRRL